MFPIDSYWVESSGLDALLPVTSGDESYAERMSRGGDCTLVLWADVRYSSENRVITCTPSREESDPAAASEVNYCQAGKQANFLENSPNVPGWLQYLQPLKSFLITFP